MHFLGSLNHFCRSDQIAQTPSGDGVSFGKRITGDGVVIHARQGCHAHMLVRRINHMLIHLVCYYKSIVFERQFADGHQLFSRKYFSARIGRIADDNGFCTCLKSFFHQTNIKLIGRRNERNVDWLCSGKNSIGSIVLIKRRKYHYFISRVTDGHHGAHHGLGSSAGNHDLRIRIDLSSDGLSLFSGKRLTEIFRTESYGILVRSCIGYFCQCIQHGFGRIKIRKSLGQVDCPVFITDSGHTTDDGICKCVYSVT